jgi:hypothetical protein
LHVVFIHTETSGDARGTDASPFQGSVKACGKGASQATVPIATLKVLDGLSMLIHSLKSLSGVLIVVASWAPDKANQSI